MQNANNSKAKEQPNSKETSSAVRSKEKQEQAGTPSTNAINGQASGSSRASRQNEGQDSKAQDGSASNVQNAAPEAQGGV